MPPYADEYGEDNYIAGAHGTIAEQQDEAFYDDRSDASDDMEKGRLKFPTEMYGRERELEMLHKLYDGLASANDCVEDKIATVAEDEELKSTPDPFIGSRVVFLSGYSGIGKSALVGEFIKQTQSKHGSSQKSSQILHASGKYTEQSTSSAPFSAIIEVLEKLALDLSRRDEAENELHTKVLSKIKESELIGPGTEGNSVLRATFTKTSFLLEKCEAKSTNVPRKSAHHSMNAIKESTAELLSVICGCLETPLVIFLDDLQWADEPSIDILSLLLTSKTLSNFMLICAYRSNEVDAEHSFSKLMNNVKEARSTADGDSEPTHGTVEAMDLFSLSPEAVKKFIADSVKKEEDEDEGGEGVEELAEAVYTKTMGNIFFVKQALEELVRKNILFYDVMCFEWRWVVSKVDLGNYMSDDVVETVKGKISELSSDIQHMLIVMAYIPNSIDVPILKALMNYGDFSFEDSAVGDLLKEAYEEGMVRYSKEKKSYVFAHDRIRQASLEFGKEKDQDELLVHISQVMLSFADQGQWMEWCLYVAVDLLNSLPPDKTNQSDLIKLNWRVSITARNRGSMEKENELLQMGMKLLESSGKLWKEYALTLGLYNAVIVSSYFLGSFDKSRASIKEVLKHAKTNHDKKKAYLYQILCTGDDNLNYSQAAVEGVQILNMYGFNIPTKISDSYIMKEEMKLKFALKNRSYSCLTELPPIDDPIFGMFEQTQKFALYSGNQSLVKLLFAKAIQLALKQGMDKELPIVTVLFGVVCAQQGKVKLSQEIGNVSLALAKRIDDKDVQGLTYLWAHLAIVPQLNAFADSAECLLQCHKDLKLSGRITEPILGSMMNHFEAYFAAGLEFGPLLESKLLLIEEYSRTINCTGFLTNYQIYRQYALNMRTKSDSPTNFIGEAFHEEEASKDMSDSARKMALRDSSSMRLHLAFVFGNEECMVQMLKRLQDYPLKDTVVARLHSRLCFTGLAVFALGKSKDNESLWKLGKNCLAHFARLTKLGSVNAKPVYKFMLAMKSPSSESFMKAIETCSEARMVHLEAITRERYAAFLFRENNETLANEYIASSYWLYQDWGAHAKALQMLQQYDFLKNCGQEKAKSSTLSATMGSTVATTISSQTPKRLSYMTPSYTFNTTLKSRSKILT